jgi:glycosyltransferase involved in cell wall biosynthesis
MRVCIVTVATYAHGIGGMQAHVLDLGRGLVRAGHEVEVVGSRHPDGIAETEHEGIRWHFVDARSTRPRLPMRNPAWLRLSSERFARLHAERPFDIVHSESTSALGLLRRGVHRRVPLAVKFHGNYLGLAQASVRRALSTPGGRIPEAKHLVWITGQHFVPLDTVYRFRSCEAMVPSRQQLGGTRWSYLLGRSGVHVVPNGVDATLFSPRPQAEARTELRLDDGPLLVAAGRLNREKGFDHALRLLADLEDEFPQLRLVIVGTGEESDSLEALAADLGVISRVVFAGKQPRELMPLYLAAADVFVFPTEREEAAPLVLPEAMAAGAPVVASDIGGVTEVIGGGGEPGVLVPPGDRQALTSAVGGLLRDEGARQRLREAARARILAEYTIERMVERTLAVYELAIARLRDPAARVRPPGIVDPGGGVK